MLGEFLARLAIALPLVCAAAVLSLLAVKRGWLRWPALPRLTLPRLTLPRLTLPRLTGLQSMPPAVAADASLAVVARASLSPAARVAVVRFAGRDHLIGISGATLTLLVSDAAGTPASAREIIP